MQTVATIIADPARARLTPELARRLVRAVAERAAAVDGPHWLAPDRACDILFADAEPAKIEAAIKAELGGLAIDVGVLPTANRRKRMLIADMDSTVITGESLDELAATVGLKDAVGAITARAMAGELDFAGAVRERVGMLKGLPLSAVEETIRALTLTAGARTLVATMRAHGAHTILVSGGFSLFTDAVLRRVGFDESHANRLDTDDVALTGRVHDPILGRDAKRATLLDRAGALGLTSQDVLAVGDGANDLAMVEAAGLGVAFRGKPVLRKEADVRIDHGDLSALLFLQGYRADTFAGG